jgi:DNA polymerase III alpha subunit (gram-positive type)
VLKAQFSSRRTQTPQQKVEFYFRNVLRLAAEIMVEHFSTDTLQRMTGLQIPPEVRMMLQDDLQRQYRIDIETDSTIAPDQEREQANMADALQAVTEFITAMGPLIQQGLPMQLALQLLKTYLRKFNWGQEIEDTLSKLERMPPPPPKPDPEQQKMQMEMQQAQQKAQLDQQAQQQEMQMKQQELALKVKELEMKLQFEQAKAQQELVTTQVQAQADQQIAQQQVVQQQIEAQQKLKQNDDSHQQKMMQARQKNAQNVQVRSRN